MMPDMDSMDINSLESRIESRRKQIEEAAIPQPFREQVLVYLRADDLVIDPSYQRDLDALKVNRIAKSFDWDSFSVLLVTRRADGKHMVLDGQHRVAAVRALGMGHVLLPCYLYKGISYQREAKIFAGTNGNRSGIPVIKAFNALLIAGDAEAVDIARIVRSAGYDIARSLTIIAGQITAVGALRRIYRVSPEDLSLILETIGEAYGEDDPDALQSWFMLGLWAFLRRYRNSYNAELLTKRLAQTPAAQLLNEGRNMAATGLCDRIQGVARAILKCYNYQAKGRRLPGWDGAIAAAGKGGADGVA